MEGSPEITSPLTWGTSLAIPVISANMDSVTGIDMVRAMHTLGGLGVLHRYMSISDMSHILTVLKAEGVKPLAVSVGVSGDVRERTAAAAQDGADIVVVDVAHGHCVMMLETLAWIKENHPNLIIIAGNVATAEATIELIFAGADVIKVGIGPGAVCTTRIVTGCGVPQFSAIAECSIAAEERGVAVIADGGIRNSGDIVKALAAGASAVMLGGLLAGTDEAPGESFIGGKTYRGMASGQAQKAFKGSLTPGTVPEGVVTMVPHRGPVRNVVEELMAGLRQGMAYLGAQTLSDLERVRFTEITAAGVGESVPHGAR
jgi:IMP dehydrogenase